MRAGQLRVNGRRIVGPTSAGPRRVTHRSGFNGEAAYSIGVRPADARQLGAARGARRPFFVLGDSRDNSADSGTGALWMRAPSKVAPWSSFPSTGRRQRVPVVEHSVEPVGLDRTLNTGPMRCCCAPPSAPRADELSASCGGG